MTDEFVNMYRNDKELKELKQKYIEKYGKPAFGFNYDEFSSFEDYKNRLRKLVEKN